MVGSERERPVQATRTEQDPWAGLEGMESELRAYLGRRCRDESEVDDVIQETYLRAARYRHALEEPGKLRGWATRIASNVLRDLQRRESRLPRADLGERGFETVLGAESDPAEPAGVEGGVRVGSHWVTSGEALDALGRAMARLRDDDRRVLQSYYCAGLSSEHAAHVCDLPRGLVKVRLFRARKRLRRMLERALGPTGGRDGLLGGGAA